MCSHVRVSPQGVPKHLHSHTPLAACLPLPNLLFPSPCQTPPPCTLRSLCASSPNYFSKLPSLSPSLISGFLTVNVQVKQPRHRSGALSLIMASVYYHFHAPSHQPIFPHKPYTHASTHLCTQMHKYTYIHVLITQLNDVCAHALITCSYAHAGLIVGVSWLLQISITWADCE